MSASSRACVLNLLVWRVPYRADVDLWPLIENEGIVQHGDGGRLCSKLGACVEYALKKSLMASHSIFDQDAPKGRN